MELWKANYYNTTTVLSITSGTLTASYCRKRDETLQYISSGFNNDATTVSMVFTFDDTMNVSCIGLLETNFKNFRIFYNGSTSNTFALTSAETSSSAWTGNTDVDKFLYCTTAAVSSITIEATETMVANSEKAIGYVFISDVLVDFERVPSSKDYKPTKAVTDIVHKLSTGQTKVNFINEHWKVDISFKYITTAFRNSLYEAFILKDEMGFVPFGTSTGWDGILFPCVWPGDFDFYKYSTDAVNSGFSGTIKLAEA